MSKTKSVAKRSSGQYFDNVQILSGVRTAHVFDPIHLLTGGTGPSQVVGRRIVITSISANILALFNVDDQLYGRAMWDLYLVLRS